jgi:hypothetical protein
VLALNFASLKSANVGSGKKDFFNFIGVDRAFIRNLGNEFLVPDYVVEAQALSP